MPQADFGALAVFGKYPRLGRVKTRLQARLTPDQCLRLYESMLADTLERTALLGYPRHLFVAEARVADPPLQERLGLAGDPAFVHPQVGEDLGERLENAFRKLHPAHGPIVFLGADSPNLPLRYVEQAFEALQAHSVVIGPSEDGGYYLLGLSEQRREIFRGIDWGTSRVLRQTLTRLERAACHLLPTWYDIDRPSDLARLREDLRQEEPGYPARTARFLATS